MNRSIALIIALLLFCAPGMVFGSTVLEDKVFAHRFENGLKLLVVERHDTPIVSAYITIGVGSVHETSETRGVAHLLEHMLFKGTETLGTTDYSKEKPLLEEIERVGSQLDSLRLHKDADADEVAALEKQLADLQAEHKQYVVKDVFSNLYSENGGVGYNAFTSKDLTTYLISLPANKLELWALIESDRMKNPVLREFYTERDVIREERRRSYDTNPANTWRWSSTSAARTGCRTAPWTSAATKARGCCSTTGSRAVARASGPPPCPEPQRCQAFGSSTRRFFGSISGAHSHPVTTHRGPRGRGRPEGLR